MARYASGKKAWGYSDRSGFRYRLSDMLTEWNGLKVGPDEYEEKHPQLEPIRPGPDPQALFQPRPDQRTETAGQRLLISNPFQSGASGSSVITVFEPSHNRSTSDVVIFRKVTALDGFTVANLQKAAGYPITVIDSNSYTITAVGTALVGNVRGGGVNGTVAPGVASTPAASTFDQTSVTLDATNKTFDEA
tara:strand:+ start:4746 stop:5318 length:573 start_codon:yes stop_codon:yes gene_type:complete